MSLQRSIPTRILEAVAREARACFAQVALGVADKYLHRDGSSTVYAWAMFPADGIVPFQINVVVTPTQFDQGLGAVNDTRYDVQVDFAFPSTLVKFADGENTYIDHVVALRHWLMRGGTWAERIGAAMRSGELEDPDNANREIAHLIGFGWGIPDPVPNTSAIVVPSKLVYETRENSFGEIV